ncbi:MAG: hypothetical protein LBS77_06340 [Desulfovibrio sp.]|nr:hypothetical protein [Desulfovibrio sp.]
MPRFMVLVFALMLAAIQGCNALGINNPFPSNPLTGGFEAATSRLLNIPLPSGMERYLSHGYQTYGAYRGSEGLETLRGKIDPHTAAQSLHSSLIAQGWQLRLSLRNGDRSVYIYERGNTLALLHFRRQTVMTILEIWTGRRLPDGTMPNFVDGRDWQTTPEADNIAPESVPGTMEQWSGSSGGLQERNL